MALCHQLGKFAFEVMPKRLPYGEMSEVERHLWAFYLEAYEASKESHGKR